MCVVCMCDVWCVCVTCVMCVVCVHVCGVCSVCLYTCVTCVCVSFKLLKKIVQFIKRLIMAGIEYVRSPTPFL